MSFKSFIVRADVDGEEQTAYIEAEDEKTAIEQCLQDFTLGAFDYPESVTLISVEEV
jgi:hypothetical protein